MESSVPFSSVPFSARFLETKPAGKNRAVKYEIFIPPQTVAAADQGDSGKFELELIAVASTPKNPRVDLVSEVIGDKLNQETIAAVHKQGISYNNTLKLPPGEYKVKFMVLNVATDTIGSVIAPLTVQ